MNYNFYSGGQDETSNLREKIFLKESKKILDSKSDLVVDEAKSAFNTYKITKDKLEELRGYVSANEELLKIYKDQFEAGNRTFVDVLDVESDLYNGRVQLIDEEMKLLTTYYTMLSLTSNLQDVIMSQPNNPCVAEEVTKEEAPAETNEVEALEKQLQ
jgi:adhesin transport system outer membrane protein